MGLLLVGLRQSYNVTSIILQPSHEEETPPLLPLAQAKLHEEILERRRVGPYKHTPVPTSTEGGAPTQTQCTTAAARIALAATLRPRLLPVFPPRPPRKKSWCSSGFSCFCGPSCRHRTDREKDAESRAGARGGGRGV